MIADRTLVLLHSATSDPGAWAPVLSGLPAEVRVLTPQLVGLESADPEPFTLLRAAEAVRATLDDASVTRATLCGDGLGALVALQLAADHPDRADRLVLMTRQTRLSPMLMSLPAAVLRLLPASAAGRLGVGRGQVLALLDQVRPVDFVPVARTVRTPTVVLCGGRDTLNKHTSSVLARTLPAGELQLIPRVGADWRQRSPQLLTDALVTILRAA